MNSNRNPHATFFSVDSHFWNQYITENSSLMDNVPSIFSVFDKSRPALSESFMASSIEEEVGKPPQKRVRLYFGDNSRPSESSCQRLFVWTKGDSNLVGQEKSNAFLQAICDFIETNSINATDCVSVADTLMITVSREKYIGTQYSLIAPESINTVFNTNYLYSTTVLQYIVDAVSRCDGKKRKVSMPVKRQFVNAVVSALFVNADRVCFREINGTLNALVDAFSIKLVHEAVMLHYPLKVNINDAIAVMSQWISLLLHRNKGTQQLDMLPEAINALGEHADTAALYVNEIGQSALCDWLNKANRKHYHQLHSLLGKLTMSPEQIASTLFVLGREYSIAYGLLLTLLSDPRFGEHSAQLSSAGRAMHGYCNNATDLSYRSISYQFGGLSLQQIMSSIAYFDSVSTLEHFELDYLAHGRKLGKQMLKNAIFHSALYISRFLKEKGVSVANVRDKSYINYPSMKQVTDKDALVQIIVEAHSDEHGNVDVETMIDTLKNSSESMSFYVGDVMAYLDVDRFLANVTTERLLNWFLNAKGLQGVDVLGKLKNEPLRKKVMKKMFA